MEGAMGSIANPFAAIAATALRCAIGIAIAASFCFAAIQASAQASTQAPGTTPPPTPAAPATYSGCVQKAPSPDTTLVISTPTACARLTGKLPVDDLSGHQVELKGILTPRTTSSSASIQVDSVISVGSSCSDVCSLRPPGARGLHPPQDGAIPGSEGGTPGAVPTPPK
jgi:hypothetical protein